MKRVLIVSMICLFPSFAFPQLELLLCGSVLAQTSPTKSMASRTIYSTVPFDPLLNRLPVGYSGHNAEQLITELSKRMNSKKDEFETTEQYQRRIDMELEKPFI